MDGWSGRLARLGERDANNSNSVLRTSIVNKEPPHALTHLRRFPLRSFLPLIVDRVTGVCMSSWTRMQRDTTFPRPWPGNKKTRRWLSPTSSMRSHNEFLYM